jgi:Ethylbenzene dehydrogenase
LEAPLASYIREIPKSYIDGLARVEKREAEQAVARKAEIEAAAQSLVAEKLAAASKAAAAPAPATAAPAAAGQQAAASAPAATTGGIDWSGVPAKTVTLFYPGQASFEWIQTGKDHGGARPFNKGERCSECHAKEVKDMGAKIVSGDKAEATPIPGKRAFVDVQVQAAYTADDVYFRVQWQNGPHKPVPFVDGGKMDPANASKLAIMFAGKEVERAEQAGCWVSCHHDSRYMPDAPKKEQLASSPAAGDIDLSQGLTKYLADTRSAVELKGGDGLARGGGDKLKAKDELAAQLGKGTYMDLLRFRSGGDPENGHIAAQRVMSGGVAVKAEGKLDGDIWTVVMSRKLKSDKPGDVSFEPGQLYTMGIALHDDYTSARFHHVSLEFRFGLDSKDAEINAVKK